MSTRTITHYVTPEDGAIGQTPLEIIATVPTDQSNKKVPISITVCYQKEQAASTEGSLVPRSNQQCTLQYYHYSLPNRIATRKQAEPIVGIPLIDSSNDWVRDISRKLADATAKKHNCPCYVAWSTTKPNDSTTISMDQMYVLRNCIQFINTLYN